MFPKVHPPKPAAPPMPVYFIQSGHCGPIKIGKSSNPDARLASMQTGSGQYLRMLAVVRGFEEKFFHQRFAAYRRDGEWFDPAPEIVDFINSIFDTDEITTAIRYGRDAFPRPRCSSCPDTT